MVKFEDFNYLVHRLKFSQSRNSARDTIFRCLHFVKRLKGSNFLNADDSISDFQKSIVEDLPYACFSHAITETKIVLRILKYAVQLHPIDWDGSVSFISSALNSSSSEGDNHERRSSDDDREITIQHGGRLVTLNIIGYYMHFANQGKLLMNSARLTDLTDKGSFDFLRCLLKCDKKRVLTFFQYGARVFGEEKGLYPTGKVFIPLVHYILWKGRQLDQWDFNLSLQVGVCDLNPHIKDVIEIFKIIMRVIPNPPEITYEVARKANNMYQIFWLHFAYYNIHTILPLYETLFPGLNFGMNQPASLKHLCRYYIRLRMNENWQLPYGIDGLRIPDTLKRYLNLLDD